MANFFIFLGGILLWLVLIVLFLAALYIHWFSRSLEYLLHTIHSQKTYSVPFWFSLLLTILFFPLTLVILLIAGFVRIIQE
ncbi:hypothetical protein K9M59_01970 [Candidatus Gracilibacteria bacterium]|nr:hypothetical protein [Candidatus Gracilibacteria bacterium]MCF7819615.1 hypothetical protein [Candidatus Gracilibacteria bacterium]